MPTADMKDEAPTGPRPGTILGLAAILLVYCTLAVIQSYATRLQWGPDEPAHIVYVRSLAMDGRLPSLTHDQTDDVYLRGAARTHQAHHPPLYYALAAVVGRAFSHRPDDTVPYTDRESGVEHSFTVPGPVRPVRLFSVLLGAVTLLCVWATARTVFPRRPEIWLAGTALLAFTPMFTYMSGVINNDSLVTALFAATAWQWARIVRFGASAVDVLILGLLVGVAVNAKETGLALVVLSAVALALEPRASSWRQRVARIGALLGLVALVGGWWFVHKQVIYGKPLV
ncbi:MAG: glycosyltransferase family 39 protein, partial [Armatimonadetes bacterium]|nr:glycosyltransferase family 39 protein [Armatimonadota bacterium]